MANVMTEFDWPARRPMPLHVTLKQQSGEIVEGGPMSGAAKHVYVKLGALPDELQKRVVSALSAIAQSSRP